MNSESSNSREVEPIVLDSEPDHETATPPSPPPDTPPEPPSAIHSATQDENCDVSSCSSHVEEDEDVPDFSEFLKSSMVQDTARVEAQLKAASEVVPLLEWHTTDEQAKVKQHNFQRLQTIPLVFNGLIGVDQLFTTVQLPLQAGEERTAPNTPSVRAAVGKKFSTLKLKLRKASRLTSDTSIASQQSVTSPTAAGQEPRQHTNPSWQRRLLLFSDSLYLAFGEADDIGNIQVGVGVQLGSILRVTVSPLAAACSLGAGNMQHTATPTSVLIEYLSGEGNEVQKLCITPNQTEESSSEDFWEFLVLLRGALLEARMVDLPPPKKGWKHSLFGGTLWSAAISGDPELVESILEDETKSEDSGDKSQTENRSQHWYNASELAALVDDEGASALHYAVLSGEPETLDIVLEKCEPNILDNQLLSPLHYAGLCGNARAIPVLLRAGCDPNLCDLQDRNALFHAVEACADAIANLDQPDQFVSTVDAFLQGDLDVQARDVSGQTTLELAVSKKVIPMVRAILEATMNLHSGNSHRSERKTTPLHLACAQPQLSPDLVQLLLGFGCDPNAKDQYGNSPLGVLLRNTRVPENSSLVDDVKRTDESLDQNIRNVQLSDQELTSRLHVALMLVSHGTRIDVCNDEGVSPADVAQNLGLTLDGAVNQWEQMKAPAETSKVVDSSVLSLPMAMDRNAPSYQKDGTVSTCPSCNVQFSFTTRRHHCRHCGQIFCNPCCNKTVPLCALQEPSSSSHAGNGLSSFSAIPSRVCIPCFNNACRVIREAGAKIKVTQPDASLIVSNGTEMSASASSSALDSLLSGGGGGGEESDRAKLFGERETDDKHLQNEHDAVAAESSKSEQVQMQKDRVQDALMKTRNQLVDRGGKLQSLADKTNEMQAGASNFADMAEKLRKQQEKDNCVCS